MTRTRAGAITKGKKRGQHPSPATVMRMLREYDAAAAPPAVPVQASPERGTLAFEVIDATPRQPVDADIERRIRDVYWTLARQPQDWIYLSRIRPLLEGVDRAVVDEVLRKMERSTYVHLAPEADQKRLTDDDRAAAVSIGGVPEHMIAIESR